jgi:hypothetical protein
MGSGFIAYATIMTIILLVGEQWVRRSGRSPEWWDSWCVVFIHLALPSSYIMFDKDNHRLGMPSDPHNSALFMTLPLHSILRESVRQPLSSYYSLSTTRHSKYLHRTPWRRMVV